MKTEFEAVLVITHSEIYSLRQLLTEGLRPITGSRGRDPKMITNADLTEAGVIREISYVCMKDGTRIAYISYQLKSGPAPT
ncbi:hypothetical protein, partial [Mesorhizobium sp. M0843]|uniref:hypothetical protein n=1 Tax=Mesorhizobium sp. M0843 TaxID=2957010 RepID=UPI0033360098